MLSLATTNPAKIVGNLKAFDEGFRRRILPYRALSAFRGVAFLNSRLGAWSARWRTKSPWQRQSRRTQKADFWVKIEAGIDEGATFSWVVIESREQRGEAFCQPCRCRKSF